MPSGPAWKRATKTIRGVEGAWIKEQKVAVSGGKVTSYQVTMLVTFVVDADDDLA